MDQARNQRQDGDLPAAAVTLERAIGIDAQDPVLWWELARLRFAQERNDESERLALRALEYAWPEDAVHAACWELIAIIRDERGDVRGAETARQQARRRS